jgi:hypothetical protein
MERNRQLTLSVKATVILLLAAAALIVIGIFNATLRWDIFGPKVEAVLYGVFFSCIALSIIGVAMTLVLGIREVVHSFQAIERSSSGSKEELPDASRRSYTRQLLWTFAALLATVAMFAAANYVIQGHRSKVFKRIAAEQMKQFDSKLIQMISSLSVPPRKNVPSDLHDLIRSIDNLAYVEKATLYLPDPTDSSAMWGFTARRGYSAEDGFAKFFVAKDFERAMAEALHGSQARMRDINNKRGFVWYYIVSDRKGKSIAVLRLEGNPRENYREYMLGS